MTKKINDLAPIKRLCKYHIVITHKYGRKIICNQYGHHLGEILRKLFNYKMLVSIPLNLRIYTSMEYKKRDSALMIFNSHGNLKYKSGNHPF